MTVDSMEIAKFDALATQWWDPNGPMKPLHRLNPLRLQYIEQQVNLKESKILDVGCGGGLLTEALAHHSTEIMGIDMSPAVIDVAKDHAAQQALNIDYQCISTAELAACMPSTFDVVVCMELLEHVADPEQCVQECACLLKPGGIAFFATINRSWEAFCKAIIGAEYLLHLLPRGTHTYSRFIRPSEVTLWASRYQLQLQGLQGVQYSPWTEAFSFTQDVAVNYMIFYQKHADS